MDDRSKRSPTVSPPRLSSYRSFKNPPQPHMCIQDSIMDTKEKLFINVMSWKQIALSKNHSDVIPLYGGMQIPQGRSSSNKVPLTIFAVMVNPEILKVNGKNAPNPLERDALVNLLCDFVEAMNPGLKLTRNPTVLKDRDLAGELKDVWMAVQAHRDNEKMQSKKSEIIEKTYRIDGSSGVNAENVQNFAEFCGGEKRGSQIIEKTYHIDGPPTDGSDDMQKLEEFCKDSSYDNYLDYRNDDRCQPYYSNANMEEEDVFNKLNQYMDIIMNRSTESRHNKENSENGINTDNNASQKTYNNYNKKSSAKKEAPGKATSFYPVFKRPNGSIINCDSESVSTSTDPPLQIAEPNAETTVKTMEKLKLNTGQTDCLNAVHCANDFKDKNVIS